VDFLRHRVQLRGQVVELSATEFRLLTVLVRNAGLVMSVPRLLNLVWVEKEVGRDIVRGYIGSLRKKLGGGPTQLIETVREFGYRYNRPGPSA
jgi:DNA-binding response OmpR family regulator